MYTVAELKKELEDCRLSLKTHEVDQEHFDAAYRRFKLECEKEGFKPALVAFTNADVTRFKMDEINFVFHTGCFLDFARGFGNAVSSVIKDYDGRFLHKAKAESVLAGLGKACRLYKFLMDMIDDDAHV